ncbi:sulfatase-like hydrolase/transferase [uncultured Salinisphaera sp.]|uniref:sulfatase-like hydrolase/transferase n=1 Tax=uncultured Salinisphaera sp. TaxID=359372 RepID=UPI0032B1F11E|tara:strand:+ start:34868 stop:36457 length:1590 start_codon:yes stop_codon:yes gene_type:complete
MMRDSSFVIIRSVVAVSLLAGLALAPAGPGTTVFAVPVIVLAVVAGLSFLRGPAGGAARVGICILFLTMAILKIADTGAARAYGRAFDPLVDMGLLPAAWNLARGTLGTASAAAILAGVVIALSLATGLLFWALGGPARLGRRTRRAALAVALVLLGVVGVSRLAGWGGLPVGTPAADYIAAHIQRSLATRAELLAFNRQLATDPLADLPAETRFAALAGQDVMLWFVESYGQNALYDPRYAATVRRRLDQVGADLDTAGLHAKSAWLVSPTYGGMSWLAHGALLSGLWTNNQSRYDTMIQSDRASLNRLFREAGWTTIAAVPAIVEDWPEADYFGFDAVYDARRLGYRGRRFNWVTMPDQFTLNRVRQIVGELDQPAMVEASLISSHAPWTPIPHLVDWEAIDDGHIFDPQALAGDSPQTVWADPARVRRQYLKSIDYVWATLGQYMRRYGDDTVFIILGDHQAAPIVSGARRDYRVPITVVAADPSVMDRLDDKYWQPGLVPDESLAARGMDQFREAFTRAMSGPVE